MTTPNKIINLLNREQLTVTEVAARLGISRNSVHLQIGKLEAAGAVEKSHPGQPAGAGKPAYTYRTAPGHEDAFSSAHKPVLSGLIETLRADMPEKTRIKLLEHTGQAMARSAGLAPTASFSADLDKAVDTVNELGAMAEIVRQKETVRVSCHSCPVATLVHCDPMVCRLVASFFCAATGRNPTVLCRHEGTVVCGFAFAAKAQ